MTGSAVSQLIVTLSSLLLARIYSASSFGEFAVFLSVVTLAIVLVSGRYEIAIVLPENNQDAVALFFLSLFLTFGALCLLSIAITLIFTFNLLELIGIDELSNYLWLIPFAILFNATLQFCFQWMNRMKKYRQMAANRIFQSSSIAIFSVAFGMFSLEVNGLVFGWVLGILASLLYALINISGDIKIHSYKLSFSELVKVAKEYSYFPKYDIVSSIINALIHQLPSIFFSALFSPAIAGYYYMTQRIIGLPLQVIGGAFGEVFRTNAAEQYRTKGRCDQLLLNSSKYLLAIGICIGIGIIFLSHWVIVFAFGEEWRPSADMAVIMVPMLIARFTASPVSYMFHITAKLHWDLIGHIIILFVLLTAFAVGWRFASYTYTLWIISCSMTLVYCGYWKTSWSLAKGKSP